MTVDCLKFKPKTIPPPETQHCTLCPVVTCMSLFTTRELLDLTL